MEITIAAMVILAITCLVLYDFYKKSEKKRSEIEDAIAWVESKHPFIDKVKPKDYIPSNSIGLIPEEVHAPYQISRYWELIMYAALVRGAYKPPKR